jgi:hypothetical protein
MQCDDRDGGEGPAMPAMVGKSCGSRREVNPPRWSALFSRRFFCDRVEPARWRRRAPPAEDFLLHYQLVALDREHHLTVFAAAGEKENFLKFLLRFSVEAISTHRAD